MSSTEGPTSICTFAINGSLDDSHKNPQLVGDRLLDVVCPEQETPHILVHSKRDAGLALTMNSRIAVSSACDRGTSFHKNRLPSLDIHRSHALRR